MPEIHGRYYEMEHDVLRLDFEYLGTLKVPKFLWEAFTKQIPDLEEE